MALACPVDLDTRKLRVEIQSIYTRVAADPSGEFHFHRGPEYAVERLGYDAAELSKLPRTVTESFAGMGVPAAELVAPAVATIELLGGALIVAGVGTRIAGLFAAAAMLGAVFTAHLSAGFFASDGGFEFPLLLACAAVALALTGPGRLSLHAAVLHGRMPLAA